MAYHSFEDLEVWKRGCRLAVDVSKAVRKSREYFIRDQMQRAALSIPSNIAEGSERESRLDYIRFLRIAKGSAAELRTQCYIASKLDILGKNDARRFCQRMQRDCVHAARPGAGNQAGQPDT